jgi:hypothetical protein
MNAQAHHVDFHFFGAAKAGAKSRADAKEPRLLGRIFDAMIESDQRRSDREIEGILARSAGRFTDAMEREMFERQYASNWWPQ